MAVVLASAEYAGVLGSLTASTGARLHTLEEQVDLHGKEPLPWQLSNQKRWMQYFWWWWCRMATRAA